MENGLIRLNFAYLRNETHVELTETVSRLIGNYTPEALGIVPQYRAYQPLLADEVSVLDVIRRSEYTGA
ncbi:MAG: hypothetical protein LBB64_06490, partial [Dysgonamonadaceae bacterium]|nr:hypothetical protein [Dysgonamonadaceae bacterium]